MSVIGYLRRSDMKNMNHKLKIIFVEVLSFLILLPSMLLGIFGAAGVCATIWGSNVLDNELGDSPDHFHPAFITFLLLMIPGMLIGAVGAIFGAIIPLHNKFKVKLSKSNRSFEKSLKRYHKKLGELLDRD